MKKINKDTEELNKRLNEIEHTDSLKEYIEDLKEQQLHASVADFLNSVIDERKLQKSELIQNAQIERSYAYQILKGTRIPSRDNLLALCLSLQLNLKQCQYALNLCGRNMLYSKQKRDAILIFGIHQKMNVMQVNEILDEYNLEVLT